MKKSTSPSDEFSRDWSEKAGDNEEEDNIVYDVDWSGDEKQRGGNVNAAPRDGNKFKLDSNLQQNGRASPQEGVKLVHVLNIDGDIDGKFDDEVYIEEKPKEKLNSGNDCDPW